MYLLPGSPREHLGVGLLVATAAILWGAVSLGHCADQRLLYRKRLNKTAF
jgi:hypothetical protein